MKSKPFKVFVETSVKFVFLLFTSFQIFVFQNSAQSLQIEKPSDLQDFFSTGQSEQNLKVFERIQNVISERYYDRKFNGIEWEKPTDKYRPQIVAVKEERELYRALSQMLAELRDAHTTVFSPTEATRRNNTKKTGTRVGIGIFCMTNTRRRCTRVSSYPTTIFIDQEGNLRYRTRMDVKNAGRDFEFVISEMLKAKS